MCCVAIQHRWTCLSQYTLKVLFSDHNGRRSPVKKRMGNHQPYICSLRASSPQSTETWWQPQGARRNKTKLNKPFRRQNGGPLKIAFELRRWIESQISNCMDRSASCRPGTLVVVAMRSPSNTSAQKLIKGLGDKSG